MDVSGQLQVPAAWPGKSPPQYRLDSMLYWLHGWYGRSEQLNYLLHQPENIPRFVGYSACTVVSMLTELSRVFIK